MPTKQIWLSAEGCSLRAVRFRQLSPAEVDQALEMAGMGSIGMSMIAYQTAYQRAGTIKMLVSYTDPLTPSLPPVTADGVQPPAEVDWSKVVWKPADPTQLEVSFGRGDIFNAKDASILGKIFTRLHDSNGNEVDLILGKAQSLP